MIDRFGLLPPPTKTLFAITRLKLLAEPLGIRKIEVGPNGGRILFKPKPNIDPLQIILLIQQQPKTYKLDGPDKLRFIHAFADADSKIEFVAALLEKLRGEP
jgi:transcription-repair coupling factor (superfamily II helicase)